MASGYADRRIDILARDKALCKKILSYHRIPVPGFLICPRGRRVRRHAICVAARQAAATPGE